MEKGLYEDFFERYGKQALWLLGLIGLYRISDIVAGNISNLFYQDLNFTKEQIAKFSFSLILIHLVDFDLQFSKLFFNCNSHFSECS